LIRAIKLPPKTLNNVSSTGIKRACHPVTSCFNITRVIARSEATKQSRPSIQFNGLLRSARNDGIDHEFFLIELTLNNVSSTGIKRACHPVTLCLNVTRVIARSEATKQSRSSIHSTGLLRSARNDGIKHEFFLIELTLNNVSSTEIKRTRHPVTSCFNITRVIARSEATKQSKQSSPCTGLLRFARNDGIDHEFFLIELTLNSNLRQGQLIHLLAVIRKPLQ
jgi:nicotinic acid mononucleotide adenylyltransferase